MGPVEEATRAELGRLPEKLAGSALAASAIGLAAGMDGQNSLTSKSMASKAHMEILTKLRELAPPEERKDGIDQLAQRRTARRARAKA